MTLNVTRKYLINFLLSNLSDKSRKGHTFYETNDVIEDGTESTSRRKGWKTMPKEFKSNEILFIAN